MRLGRPGKKKIAGNSFQFQRQLENGQKLFFNLPDIRSEFGSRNSDEGMSVVHSGSAEPVQVILATSADRSVVRIVAAFWPGSAESALV